MSYPDTIHGFTECQESKSHTSVNINQSSANDPSRETIRSALATIRPSGLQNLLAIPLGGSPIGVTFDLPARLDQAAVWATNQNAAGHNVYFTVNPVSERVHGKPNKTHIAAAEYAHVDIDPDPSNGYGEERDRLLNETLPELQAFTPAPSFIIDSGNGLGVFWRLIGASIAETEDLNRRLIVQFGGDPGTYNIDRLMRLPGTLNYPTQKKLAKGYPKEPSSARLLATTDGTYTADMLANVLPVANAVKPIIEVAKQSADTKGVKLTPLDDAQKQRVEERLQALLDKDSVLRSRWEGSACGLADPSRSGRDLSVAAMLKHRGFTFSETTHLITNCFQHGLGTECDERYLTRCWERSGHIPQDDTVRGWINSLYSHQEAARHVGLDPEEFVGLDAYSILIRGTEVDTHSDYEKTLTEVVRHAHLQALRKLNESHAKTMIGGKVAIIREYEDPNFQIPTYAIMAPPQFSEWYRGNTAYKLVENKPKLTNLGKDWLEWSGQRRYNAMTFKPALMDDTVYNAWTGFPVKSVDGDWGLMKELMLEGLCDGNHVYYEWLMDWMAVGLQAPTERYGVATVLRGEKGIGKGQFAKWYGRLFGNHFLHLSNARHLLGNFNAHFERALLVFADELIWGGNKQEEGVLKSFVTEELIPIEHKGYDVEMRPNYARLLVASNEEWAVPAGTHERRWFVLDVSSKYRQNTDFFGALTTQMQSGGLEAMMFELINRKTTTNQRKPPKTKALAAVAVMGLDDVASWLYDALSAGELYDSEGFRSRAHLFIRTAEDYEALRSAQARVDRCPVSDPLEIGFKPIWPYGVDKDALYKSYEAHCRQRNRYGRAKDRGAFYKRLKTLLPSAKEERPRFNGIQVKIVLWPLLMQAREEFNRHSGLDFEYEQEYEDAA